MRSAGFDHGIRVGGDRVLQGAGGGCATASNAGRPIAQSAPDQHALLIRLVAMAASILVRHVARPLLEAVGFSPRLLASAG